MSFEACLKCTICVAHCPVLRVAPAFRGPKLLGPDLARLREPYPDLPAALAVDARELDQCTGCRTCDLVCPAGVSPSELIREARSGTGPKRFRDLMLGRNEDLARIVGPLAAVANAAMSVGTVARVAKTALRLAANRPLPRYARQALRAWGKRRSQAAGVTAAEAGIPGRVAYFYGCYANYHRPELGQALVEVLERNGFQVTLPEQRCCGLPMLANGDRRRAIRNAEFNLSRLLREVEAGAIVVTTCTSCALALRRDYPRLLGAPAPGGDGAAAEAARRVAAKVYDVSELLLELHAGGQLDTGFGAVPGLTANPGLAAAPRLGYHAPCHQKMLGIGTPALELLSLVPGLEVHDLDAGCCGMAGTHGFKAEHYAAAMAIGEPLFEAVQGLFLAGGEVPPAAAAARLTGATVLTDCGTCQMQIEHGTGARTMHPVEVLRLAYRRGDEARERQAHAGTQGGLGM